MGLKKIGLGKLILLSIVTCGIYSLIWSWNTMNALDAAGGPSKIPPIAQFLLTFCYVGYAIFGWCAASNMANIYAKSGKTLQDQTVVYVLLGVFCPIALIALIQYHINEVT